MEVVVAAAALLLSDTSSSSSGSSSSSSCCCLALALVSGSLFARFLVLLALGGSIWLLGLGLGSGLSLGLCSGFLGVGCRLASSTSTSSTE
jgi:hypothetical protein